MRTTAHPIPLADTLRLLLPPAAPAALLQAALLEGEAARCAWQRFLTLAGDPKAFLQDDRAGVKRHLPLLHENLGRQGIAVDRSLQPVLRTATLREELRAARFRRAMRDGLAALHGGGVPCVLVKGAALGETVYDRPTLRHSHDVDVLVREDELPRAVEALRRAGFARSAAPLGDGGVRMDHASGLPIELHRRLFEAPFGEPPQVAMMARAQAVELMGVPVRVFEPADALAHVIGHALFNTRRDSFAWLVDAALIARRHPGLAWQRSADVLIRSGLSLPAAVLLRDLAERFAVPVPGGVLSMVDEQARSADRLQRALVVDMLRRRPHRRLIRLLGASGPRSRVRVIAALAAPPPAYLRRIEGAASPPALLACYLRRPVRFAWRQVRKGAHRVRRAVRPAPVATRTLERASP